MIRFGYCLLLLSLAGCATHIAPKAVSNPLPARPLAGASSYTMKPLQVSPEIREREPRVSQMVQEKISARVGSIVNGWNHNVNKKGPAIVLSPAIQDLKFISRGERVLAGAMAGGSAIVLRLDITDGSTGATIASPIFYQHANALGSAWTFGSTDQDMLDRVVDMMAEYLTKNYAVAVGGPTGVPLD